MAEESHEQEIAKKAVVYQRNDTNAVTVQCDIPYARRDGEQLTLDVYRPAQEWSPLPAVLFVTGFPDAGMRRVVGCNAKDMASYISWAKLMAASGIVAITYTNRTPTADAGDVLRYVRENAASPWHRPAPARRVGVLRQCAHRAIRCDG